MSEGLFKKRLDRFGALSTEEKLELATALVRRGDDRRDAGLALFQKKDPHLSDSVARAAAFHAYLELPGAMLDLMAWMEQCVREDDHDVHYGTTWEVMYHLYNWMQIEELIPYSAREVIEDLQEASECLSRDDKDSASAMLKDLIERFEGGVAPPKVER